MPRILGLVSRVPGVVPGVVGVVPRVQGAAPMGPWHPAARWQWPHGCPPRPRTAACPATLTAAPAGGRRPEPPIRATPGQCPCTRPSPPGGAGCGRVCPGCSSAARRGRSEGVRLGGTVGLAGRRGGVHRECHRWIAWPAGGMRGRDPEDTAVEVWAGLESADVRGHVFGNVQGSGSVDVEGSN